MSAIYCTWSGVIRQAFELNINPNPILLLDRLLDVVHSDQKLYLVFEFLNLDLKKYMDNLGCNGQIPPALVKVGIIKQEIQA